MIFRNFELSPMPLSFSYSTAATAGSREDPDSPAVSTVTEPNDVETTAAATGFTATTAEDHAETHPCQCKCLLENCDCFLIQGFMPGRVGQSVTCLTTDASLTADPGVASSIPARSHTFVKIGHEIISRGHSPPFR